MLSANVAFNTVSPFPGIASKKIQLRAAKPVARVHALGLVEEVGTYGNRMAKRLHMANAPAIGVKPGTGRSLR